MFDVVALMFLLTIQLIAFQKEKKTFIQRQHQSFYLNQKFFLVTVLLHINTTF